MKKILLPIIAITAIAAMAFKMIDPLPIGSVLPQSSVKMKDINGKEVSLKDAKSSKGLLVMFSCNTCPYVIKNQERTNAICTYALKNNIGVILVNSNEAQRNDEDSYDAMKNYAKQQGYNWHYVVDDNSSIANAFGANRTPECFLFDGSDKLVYHGAIDDNPTDASNVTRQHLKTAIEEMTAGKNVSVKESRSAGCTIKRKN
ncbi:MAG: thioredoxin family protein [Ferruginibacter sp.]